MGAETRGARDLLSWCRPKELVLNFSYADAVVAGGSAASLGRATVGGQSVCAANRVYVVRIAHRILVFGVARTETATKRKHQTQASNATTKRKH